MADIIGSIVLLLVLMVVLGAYNTTAHSWEWTFDGTHHVLKMGER